MNSRKLTLAALHLTLAACAGDAATGGPDAVDAADTEQILVPDIVLFPDTRTLADSATAPPTDAFVPATDTAGPTDTAAPPADTVSPPADTTPIGCTAGAACDDLDPCTVNDQCVGGACVGTPRSCDDGLACTADSCLAGQCQHAVQPGACLIGGACVADQQLNPANPCQRCAAAQSTTAWSNLSGVACDDGDPCTTGSTCQAGACGGGSTPAEICDDGVDNDCNGATDGEDVACGGVQLCTHHADCGPGRVCGLWFTPSELRCSLPCGGPGQCAAGQICSKVPGSVQMGYCQDAQAGLLLDGAACTDDSQCKSRLCTGVCESLCLSQPTCSLPGHSCHPVGDLAAGYVAAACSPNPPGALGNGQLCTTDGVNFDSALCASGHCDFAYTPEQLWRCAPLCRSEADCAPTQECNIVIASPFPNAGTVPFSPDYTPATHDAVSACYTPPSLGPLAIGAACTTPDQCSSRKCMAVGPGGATHCTGFCNLVSDCPVGMRCGHGVVNLTSAWLAASGASSSAPTYVGLCSFPSP